MPAHRPEELHELFLAGLNAKDADAIMDLYEPDAVGVDLRGEPLRGQAMRENMAGMLERVDRFEVKTRKSWVNGEVALLSSTWSGVVTTPDGQRVVEGTSAEIARRQPDGTWLLVIDDPAFS